MANDSDDGDKKVKDVLANELDPKTRADLERWFGMPSFDQLAEQGVTTPEQDAEINERAVRQQKAIEAVDPALLAAHAHRTRPGDDLLVFKAAIEVAADPSIAKVDLNMVEASIAEPREYDIPEQLRDDLKECTPQALLRDLHRPETDFEKQFEVVDDLAEQRVDHVAEIATAMTTNWKLPPMVGTPYHEAQALVIALRKELRGPWRDVLPKLPRRRWTPEEDR